MENNIHAVKNIYPNHHVEQNNKGQIEAEFDNGINFWQIVTYDFAAKTKTINTNGKITIKNFTI